MSGEELIHVNVVAALADSMRSVPVSVQQGSTVLDALRACADQLQLPELLQLEGMVGVFGARCELGRPLQTGDRVELYRPLLLDAKAARRLRAARTAGRKC